VSLFNLNQKPLKSTSVKLGGKTYGATADRRGPIGGGEGYKSYPKPTHTVDCLDALLTALTDSVAGEVISILGDVTLECTERVYVDKIVLEIPEGVTLASDRGKNSSEGALIRSDTIETKPLIRVMGPNARITGLRLSGPNARQSLEHHGRAFKEGRGHDYYYRFPTSDGVETRHPNLTVDNCELAGWGHAAVWLREGIGHHIHHNFIHHNQYQGLGYGVSHDVAHSTIERNHFNYNRHSIAGTGKPGCGYVAKHNVEVSQSLSHCFDMHGGRDRKDGTDVAGTNIAFKNNTFWCAKAAIKIRGVSEKPIAVKNNWFYHKSSDRAIIHEGSARIGKNAWGRKSPILPTE
jgi:hypothetical protein